MVSRVTRVPVEKGWSVKAVGGDAVPVGLRDRAVPASVPGCVTTDLLAAGLIPDPYLDGNETELAWIGLTDWCFATAFELEAIDGGERVDLVCEGLDTVAAVRCNGTVVARTANMHRGYRVDLRSTAVAGRNELTVTFDAPVPAAERLSEQLGRRPHVIRHPFNAIRKMACSYGWDWGPDLASSGIWRPIAIERWRTARLASVRPLATVASVGDGEPGGRPHRGAGKVEFHVAVERAAPGERPLEVTCRVGDHVGSASRHRGRARPNPLLLGGEPLVVWRRRPPQRLAARDHARLGRVEPARLPRLRRLPAAFRFGVRVPGTADMVDIAPGRARRADVA